MPQLTLQQIADLTNGTILSGEPTEEFTGLNALADARSTDVSFLGNQKYLPAFEQTEAGCVLVASVLPSPASKPAQVQVANPTMAFGAIIEHFKKSKARRAPGAHPRSIVDPSAQIDLDTCTVGPGAVIETDVKIGHSTIIGAGAVISEGCRIGADCHIHANVTLTEDIIIGDRVTIHPGTVIGSDGFGYELIDGALQKVDQLGTVVIEDDVEIGSNVTIDRARFGETLIGEGTKIDNLVQIAHNVKTGKHCIIVAQAGIAGSTHLGNYVTVAAQAGVAGHLKLNDGFQLSAQSGLTKDGPAGQAFMGKPARPMRQALKTDGQVARLPKLIERVKRLEEKSD